MKDTSTIYVVEDDREMRQSLVWMLSRGGYDVASYARPDELLDACDPRRPGCLVLDFQLPGMSGLELGKRLRQRGCRQPFIVLSAHGTVPLAVEAMRDGAVDFIEKPFRHTYFLERIAEAIQRDRNNRQHRIELEDVRSRIELLTPREREVMRLVVAGQLTKQIARKLRISPKTVEVHRSHVTRKMNVKSVAQLVRVIARNASDLAF